MTLPRDIAARLSADPELAARVALLCEGRPVGGALDTPTALYDALTPLLAGRESEAVAVVALNTRLRIVDSAVLTVGTDTAAMVDPKQILRWCLTRRRPVSAFVLAHNHPSGEASPSRQDDHVTSAMQRAAYAVGLRMVDHVIYCDGGVFYSYAALGRL